MDNLVPLLLQHQVGFYWSPLFSVALHRWAITLGKCCLPYCWGKHTNWNCPPWPGTVVTICMSCFTTGGPGKEQGTNKPPWTGRVQERSKGDTTCLTTSQNPPLWHPSWLNKAFTTRKNSESEWLAKDNLETNPITIKPETASHRAVLLGSLTLLLSTRCPFPIKSLALSAHVSPRTIHSQVLDKSPVSGPGRGSPFLQHFIFSSVYMFIPSSQFISPYSLLMILVLF